MNITSKEIHNKALELGYVSCGIVRSSDMHGYSEKINQRIECFPLTNSYNSIFAKFANPEETEPWVKAVVVCVGRYGKYKVTEELQGRIGKYYLMDYRVVPESKENQAAVQFDLYLSQNGIKFKKQTMFGGSSACRYAAVKAGLGVIRKNNFLYTEFGSWVWLETWLIYTEMEYICEPNIAPCPNNCTKCIDACATGALAEPYQMNALTCTSMLTWGGQSNTLPPEELRLKMKG